MSIEITVSLVATVGLSFDVEPGTVVTAAMINDKIDSLQRYMDKYQIDAGDCTAYIHATDFKSDNIDAYNRENGEDFTVLLDAPAEPLIKIGYEVRHDALGFYVCTIEEAEHEDGGNPSVGFDGREHFATIVDAWRSFV